MIENFERRQAAGDNSAVETFKYLLFSAPEEKKKEDELEYQKYEYISLLTVS